MFKNLFSTHSRLSWAVLPLVSLGFTSQLAGQPFTTIYNIPPDTAPASIDSDTQLNLSAGGVIGDSFNSGYPGGSSRNMEVNISGGVVGYSFRAYGDTVMNISGGLINAGFTLAHSSVINFSGGTMGAVFVPTGTLRVLGDEFIVDGTAVTGLINPGDTVTINGFGNMSATLADGSVTIFAPESYDLFWTDRITLVKAAIPGVGLSVINSPGDPVPNGLRSGQTLNLSSGGVLGDYYAAVGATLNINGGVAGGQIEVASSSVTITGGTVGGGFRAFTGSTIHMTDGMLGDNFGIFDGVTATIDGGVIGDDVVAFAGSKLTINGGAMGADAIAQGSSSVFINGGVIGNNFDAYPSSTVAINGGVVGDYFDAYGSTVNMTGGVIGNIAEIQNGSTMHISGGRIGQDFNVFAGSTVEFIGGEFLMDGQPIVGLENPGDTVTLSSLATLTGTLEDGSVFVFSSLAEDDFDPGAVVLRRGSVPVLSPVTINAPADPIPNGVRAGQTLNLSVGADVGDNFAAVGGTLNIQGGAAGFGLEIVDTAMTIDDGAVGDNFKAYDGSVVELLSGSIGIQGRALAGSTVNISGGTLGNNLAAFAESTINISGGMIPASFRAFANSEVNLVGQSFFVTDPLNPGELIDLTDGLTPGDPMLWTDRVGTLSGTLLDGSTFSFNLSAFINSQATLTILLPTLVGDLDGDGFVGLDDLNLVLSNWNQNVPPGDPLADPSGDGFVGIDDLATVLGHWNAGTLAPPASVPEPVGLTLFAAGLGLVLGRRGRAVCVC